MTNQIRLAPAQQEAADRLSSSLPKGDIFILRGQPGMGRTTVLSHVHRIAGGAFLGVRQFIEELAARSPEAIEEAFLAILDRALTESDVVIVDDLHLVTAIANGCDYPRSNLLDVALTAVMTDAVARDKKLVFGTAGDEPAPVTRRATIVEIAEFGADDYACICEAWLSSETAAGLDYGQVHRFAPALTAHQLRGTCRWLADNSSAATDDLIAYLREHFLASNVELDQVAPVELRDLKGVDDVVRALEAKIALPLENDALAAQYGLKPKRGVLLAGPPGTGKTTIGRALAHRLKSKFFLIDGTVIAGTDRFYTQVRQVFEDAKKNAPSIIFIDDSDVIFEGKEEHGLYRYLLTMLDGLESASAGRVCVMMTAMNVGSLPRAMVRSGRVELWLETRLPDIDARVSILKGLLAGLPAPLEALDIEVIATSARGLTGADLKAVVEDGKLLFAHDVSLGSAPRPVEDYFLEAIDTVRANQLNYARAKPARVSGAAPVGFVSCEYTASASRKDYR
jgi:transitional endoplasmic reticulum ATPase